MKLRTLFIGLAATTFSTIAMTQASIGQALLVKRAPRGIKSLAWRDNRFKWMSANTCLECGIRAHGFARACRDECRHDFLIAYSCKSHGVCPSCNMRRMAETTAHLVDHAFPPLPVRPDPHYETLLK